MERAWRDAWVGVCFRGAATSYGPPTLMSIQLSSFKTLWGGHYARRTQSPGSNDFPRSLRRWSSCETNPHERNLMKRTLMKRSSSMKRTKDVIPSNKRGKGSEGRSRALGRWTLGGLLLVAGISHLSWNRKAFLAQVPPWMPVDADVVVVVSGIVEIALGSSLLFLRARRTFIGWIIAAFFVAIFPGNISQLVTHTDSFGLNSDRSRGIRLVFQPVLVAWALWCTGAWADRNALRHDS